MLPLLLLPMSVCVCIHFYRLDSPSVNSRLQTEHAHFALCCFLFLQNFKAALGLTDVDAAPVHIDVGRRILRGRMEAGSRGEDIEASGAWGGGAGVLRRLLACCPWRPGLC